MIRALGIMIQEVSAARSVLVQLTRQQLILRYRRTMLGYLWTLVNPLLMMTITALVFSNLFKADLKTFAIFMFAGMVPWNFFNAMVVQSANTFIINEGLIKKIYLPKILFPLSIACATLVDSVLSLAALSLIIMAIGAEPSWALLFLPVAYVLTFFFALGISMIISVATVFYRDLQHMIAIAMQALFFLTPIIYDKTAIIGGVSVLLELNPVTPFIELFRSPIRYGEWPDGMVVLHASAIALASLAVGLLFFLRLEKKIVFRL
jgi:ABC-2 type transport system permease protein/lipopolysaccharide transport system permease protein